MSADRGLGSVQFVLFLLFFVGVGDSQMLSPTLPLIAADLGVGIGAAGSWLGTFYALAAGLAALTTGPLSDRFGRKFFLRIGLTLVALAGLVVPLAGGLEQLAAVRLVAGFGGGILSTCSIAYAGDFIRYQRRGRAMGVIQSAYFAAFVVTIPVASFLAGNWGWHAAYLATGVLAVLAWPVLQWWLPDDRLRPHAQGHFLDLVRLRQHRRIYAAVAGSFFVSAGFVGFLQYFGSFLAEQFSLSVSRVGIVFLVVGVASVVGSVLGGALSDKLGKRPTVVGCSAVLAVLLVATARSESLIGVFGFVLAAAVAYAFRQGPLQALVTGLVPTGVRGAFVAMRNTMSQFGVAFGSMLCGELYTLGGFSAVGWASGVLTLCAALCMTLVREPGDNP
ncbi:MAG: MFS transporter [Acidobacteriota bacterium]